MAATESMLDNLGYSQQFQLNERTLTKIFGSAESLVVTDTQFFDHIKHVASNISITRKVEKSEEVFLQDCKRAFTMGVKFASLL